MRLYPASFKMKNAYFHPTFQNLINNWDVKIFNVSDLPLGNPPTTFTTVNGHIKYQNIYMKKPGSIVSSAALVEVPLGSGNFYKVKPDQYVINPVCNEQRLKEEIAFAMTNKVSDPTCPTVIGNPRWGRTDSHVARNYDANFF